MRYVNERIDADFEFIFSLLFFWLNNQTSHEILKQNNERKNLICVHAKGCITSGITFGNMRIIGMTGITFYYFLCVCMDCDNLMVIPHMSDVIPGSSDLPLGTRVFDPAIYSFCFSSAFEFWNWFLDEFEFNLWIWIYWSIIVQKQKIIWLVSSLFAWDGWISNILIKYAISFLNPKKRCIMDVCLHENSITHANFYTVIYKFSALNCLCEWLLHEYNWLNLKRRKIHAVFSSE